MPARSIVRSHLSRFFSVALLFAACSEAPSGRSGSGGNGPSSEVAGESGGPCYPNATRNAGLYCVDGRWATPASPDTGVTDTGSADATDTSDTGAANTAADTAADTRTPPVEQTVGPEGGVIEFDGIRLTILAWALAAATPIAISFAENQSQSGYALYTPIYRFEPAGTTFAIPATVSAGFSGDPGRATLFWTPEGGTGFERRGGRFGADA